MARDKLTIQVETDVERAEQRIAAAVSRMNNQQVELDLSATRRQAEDLRKKLEGGNQALRGAGRAAQDAVPGVGALGTAMSRVAGVDILRSLTSLRAGLAGLVGLAGAAGAALVRYGREVMQTYLETDRSARALEITTRQYEGLQFVAKATGTEMGSLARAVSDLTRRVGEAATRGGTTAAAFRALGLSLGELQAMDPATRFRAVAAALAQLPDPALRATYAQETMGRAYRELMPLLDGTRNSLAALIDEGERYAVQSEQQTQLARDHTAALARLDAQYNQMMDGFGESTARVSATWDELVRKFKLGGAALADLAAGNNPFETARDAGLAASVDRAISGFFEADRAAKQYFETLRAGGDVPISDQYAMVDRLAQRLQDAAKQSGEEIGYVNDEIWRRLAEASDRIRTETAARRDNAAATREQAAAAREAEEAESRRVAAGIARELEDYVRPIQAQIDALRAIPADALSARQAGDLQGLIDRLAGAKAEVAERFGDAGRAAVADEERRVRIRLAGEEQARRLQQAADRERERAAQAQARAAEQAAAAQARHLQEEERLRARLLQVDEQHLRRVAELRDQIARGVQRSLSGGTAPTTIGGQIGATTGGGTAVVRIDSREVTATAAYTKLTADHLQRLTELTQELVRLQEQRPGGSSPRLG